MKLWKTHNNWSGDLYVLAKDMEGAIKKTLSSLKKDDVAGYEVNSVILISDSVLR